MPARRKQPSAGEELAAEIWRNGTMEADSLQMRFPFTPKSTADLEPGQFWGIPLEDGRFACGRVLSWTILDGRRHTWWFHAGLMDWIGHQPPTSQSIAGRKIVAFGDAHMDVILEHGRRVLGFRDLRVDDLEPGLLLQGEYLALGAENIREATERDQSIISLLRLGAPRDMRPDQKTMESKGVAGANKRPKPQTKLEINELRGA